MQQITDMNKVIKQAQNNGKALEIRLEQHGTNYHVVVAGITFNLRTGCSGGTCDYTSPDNDYYQIENETHKTMLCKNYQEATTVYNTLKAQIID